MRIFFDFFISCANQWFINHCNYFIKLKHSAVSIVTHIKRSH